MPLTAEEKEQLRVYHLGNNRKSRQKQAESVEGRAKLIYHEAQRRAAQEGLPFDLTLEWVEERVRAGKCEVTGIDFDLRRPKHTRAGRFCPSVDRIEPSKGYTTANSRIVIFHLNISKLDFTDAELLELARAIVKAHETRTAVEVVA